MTRFQKLAALTLATTLLLVVVGVIVRATDSGLGCPDWPLCYGQLIPPLDDPKAWIEWIHRDIAAIIGFQILGLAFLAVRDHRDRPSLLWPSFAAVGLVGFQAWLGRETVRLGNSGESVTAHLAAAMTLVGLLVFLTVRAGYPGPDRAAAAPASGSRCSRRSRPRRRSRCLLFGSHVTATDSALVFPDWPLMGGSARAAADGGQLGPDPPPLGRRPGGRDRGGRRDRRRADPASEPDASSASPSGRRPCSRVQVVVGGLQVLTQLSAWTQTLHLALGAIIWSMQAGLVTVVSYYTARTQLVDPGPPCDEGSPESPRSRGDSVRAYIALTKPRIIELLLVTTVPAMVLATRWVPGIDWGEWGWLVFWTMLGGTLAAGSANAINCYLDRDIDELMARTRRRPLPAHQVEPERAVVFGLVLGVISFVADGLVREPAGRLPDAARHRVLRRRVHDDAQADDTPRTS